MPMEDGQGGIPVKGFDIRVEYTGIEPNLKPAASAFVWMMKNAVNADGTFTDPELEAEYQKWREQHEALQDIGA